MLGRVKSWNDSKGIGFITPDDNGQDIVFRFSGIAPISMSGDRFVKEGKRVTFDITTDSKGKQAINVTVVE